MEKIIQMPFTQEFIQIDQVNIHLLRFVDFNPENYLDHLTPDEQERYFGFHHFNRKQEFTATRILRHRLFGYEHIHYDTHGAPYIEGEGFISISHAKGIVGIALCKDFKIGLDLETVRSKASKLASKFLSESESTQFDFNDPVEMTKVWSAKEVLYKLAGRRGIHFKSELLLYKENKNSWRGLIRNENHELHTKLSIFDFQDTIVSVNTHACEIK